MCALQEAEEAIRRREEIQLQQLQITFAQETAQYEATIAKLQEELASRGALGAGGAQRGRKGELKKKGGFGGRVEELQAQVPDPEHTFLRRFPQSHGNCGQAKSVVTDPRPPGVFVLQVRVLWAGSAQSARLCHGFVPCCFSGDGAAELLQQEGPAAGGQLPYRRCEGAGGRGANADGPPEMVLDQGPVPPPSPHGVLS